MLPVDKIIFQLKRPVENLKGLPVGANHLGEKLDFKNPRHRFLAFFFICLVASVNLLVFLIVESTIPQSKAAAISAPTFTPYDMKVLSLRYFPLDPNQATGSATPSAQLMDSATSTVTPGTTLDDMRARVDGLRDKWVQSMNKATKFHGYKDPNAQASLNYSVYDEKEFLKPIPISSQFTILDRESGTQRPTADHLKVLAGNDSTVGINNICDYVDNHGVKEVWIFFYHTQQVAPVESNMAPKAGGTFGTAGYKDVSNSLPADDLPRCSKTYTVYDANYNRGINLHTFGHQVESIFSNVDPVLWQAFYQPTASTSAKNHCGTTHLPPNTKQEYQYNSTVQVQSDCANWKPDGSGQAETVDCHTWAGADCGVNTTDDAELAEHTWWFQNFPGYNNGLTFNGAPVRNFWDLLGDYDNFAMPPVITIQGPAQNAGVSGVINITAGATYAAGIQKLEFFVQGSSTPFYTSTSSPATASLDTSLYPKGNLGISIKVTGNGGSLGNISTANLTVVNNSIDTKPPMIEVISPEYGELVKDNKVTISFKISDNIGFIVDDFVIHAGDPSGARTVLQLPTPVNGMYTLKPNIADGAWWLSIIASDASGNFSDTYGYFFDVAADTDKDGFKDIVEQISGTDPLVACGVNAWLPDLNNNKVVNSADLDLEAKHYANKNAPNYDRRYDMNGDGAVNSADIGTVAKYYGKSCTDTSVHQSSVAALITTQNCPGLPYNYQVSSYVFHTFDQFTPFFDRVAFVDVSGNSYTNGARMDDGGQAQYITAPAGVYKVLNMASKYYCDQQITVI